MNKPAVLVGVSGGVDSAVTAHLLQQAGHPVRGVFMNNWQNDNPMQGCQAVADGHDAQTVCNQLSIPLLRYDGSKQYQEQVFAHFLNELTAMRTPNPDTLCNRHIKFPILQTLATQSNASIIATGHYARTRRCGDHILLCKGIDSNKDQSYFLYMLNQQQLANCRFPLGEHYKTTIRRIASDQQLSVAQKKDSTGICFIGEQDFKQFCQRFLAKQPGDIIDEHGRVLGEHDGLMFYTIGQRQGLNIGGQRHAAQLPWYVAKKITPENKLLVVQGSDHPLLFTRSLLACQPHWIRGMPPAMPATLQAKIRYRQSDQPATITVVDKDYLRIDFIQPQRAATPGQSVVFYDHDICLGGAIIEHTHH